MGDFEKVLEQRRSEPLRTVRVRDLLVPTPAEMLRVKAFLLSERRATRDYVDVVALVRELGEPAAERTLGYLNLVYPAVGSQSTLTRFAEACLTDPLDLSSVALASYKGLKAPFTDWSYVANACRRLGQAMAKLELTSALPSALDAGFYQGLL